MTHLVTESCINCKHTDCVSVCPVDCFYEGENFLSINPDECIDCGVCIPECPVDAIVAEDDLPEDQRIFWLDVNTRTSAKWPVITRKKDPLPDHQEWNGKSGKIDLLQE
jgi:ferredoxin